MTLVLPPGWSRTDSSVDYCFTNGTYRCYIYVTLMNPYLIEGYGARKETGKWIIPWSYTPSDIRDITTENIQKLLNLMIDRLFMYEL